MPRIDFPAEAEHCPICGVKITIAKTRTRTVVAPRPSDTTAAMRDASDSGQDHLSRGSPSLESHFGMPDLSETVEI